MPYKEIPIDKIDPNPFQTRKKYDPEVLEGLMKSASDNIGIRSAPLVRPHPVKKDRYQIASGHGRVQAWKALGHKTMMVRVEELDDLQMAKEALVENVHRQGLDEEEILQALEKLAKLYKIPEGRGKFTRLYEITGIPSPSISDYYDYHDMRTSSSFERELKPGIIQSTRGLPKSERIQLAEKATKEDWGKETTFEVKMAVKEMQPQVRAEVLKEKTKLPPKVIVAVSQVKEPKMQEAVLKEIRQRKLDEELALKFIERAKAETKPLVEVSTVDEKGEVLEELQRVYELLAGMGVNQRMILGDQWRQGLDWLERIERKLGELKVLFIEFEK